MFLKSSGVWQKRNRMRYPWPKQWAVACAAALASISEILDRHLSENAEQVGNYLIRKLSKLPHVRESRGKGFLVGCEYELPIAMDVKWGCMKRHALITAIGTDINRMIPQLIAGRKDVDRLVDIMQEAVEEAAANYFRKNRVAKKWNNGNPSSMTWQRNLFRIHAIVYES